ncbi:hypothetical protein CTAYLR_004373 [Chrysophaeum taylorii]|uniref:Nuclear pore complex NUP2/50/61 domain-containing protein n=1 Tax=Chrysophaeum taylorii TaxID=2483200 RepID=A0AAD7ULV0_9STRA|nr:hypothetical protein CTAYLR_004373 [Chrysophaeum taylorii]
MRREEYEAAADASSETAGTFKRASDEVLKKRRIVKARRPAPAPVTVAAAANNPFASVTLSAKPAANSFAAVSLVPAPAPTDDPEPSSGDPINSNAIDDAVGDAPAPSESSGDPQPTDAPETKDQEAPETVDHPGNAPDDKEPAPDVSEAEQQHPRTAAPSDEQPETNKDKAASAT